MANRNEMRVPGSTAATNVAVVFVKWTRSAEFLRYSELKERSQVK